MDSESIRFEDVLTQLEQKRQQLEKEKAEVDRLYAQREEDARKAREFRTQMERAKENARSRGEAEAKRPFWLRPSPSRTTRSASSTRCASSRKSSMPSR